MRNWYEQPIHMYEGKKTSKTLHPAIGPIEFSKTSFLYFDTAFYTIITYVFIFIYNIR
jgi:hypothetical protein